MKPLELSAEESGNNPVPGEAAVVADADLTGASSHQPPNANEAPRGLSLRVNFSWTLAGNIIYAGCQWAILVVLARLGRAEMVGQFALGLAITAPVLMCSNLNLRSVQATDARNEYNFGDYLNLRLFTTAVAMPIIAGIAFFSGYSDVTLAVILLLGLSKCFEAISDIFYGLLQQNERMRPIAISMMLKGIFSLFALAATLYLTGSLLWAIASLCVVWGLVLTLYDVPVSFQMQAENSPRARANIQPKQLLGQTSLKVATRLAWLAAPMGLVMFLISLGSNVPRYFIERQIGLHELGIFAAITYLMTAGGTVVGALGQSATPRLSNLYADGKRAAFGALLWKLAAISTIIGVGGLLVAALFGKPVLGLLYGKEYSQHGALFIALMAVAWLSYIGSLLGYGMSAARRFRVQAPIYFLALVATLVGCFFLIPSLGLVGAALAMGVGTVVQIICGLVVMVLALRDETPASEGRA